MPVRVTKKREARAGLLPCWRIHFDGKPTRFFIEKGEGPKWGNPQQYDLCHDDLGYVAEGGVWGLMKNAEAFANPFSAMGTDGVKEVVEG